MKKIITICLLVIIYCGVQGNPIPFPPPTMCLSGFATGENSSIGILLDSLYCVITEDESITIKVYDREFALDPAYSIAERISDIYLPPDSGTFSIIVNYGDEYSEIATIRYNIYSYYSNPFPKRINPELSDEWFQLFIFPPPEGYYYCFDNYYYYFYDPHWPTEHYFYVQPKLIAIEPDGPHYPTRYSGIERSTYYLISEIAYLPVEFIEFNNYYTFSSCQLLTPTGMYSLVDIDYSGSKPVYNPPTNIFGDSPTTYLFLLEDDWILEAVWCTMVPPEGFSYISGGLEFLITDIPTPGENNNVSIQEPENIVQIGDIKILKTYPEPFNSQFTIAYTIPKNTNNLTIIKIHDITGRLVKEQNIPSTSGFHSKIIKSEDMPSGVYLASVVCGNMKDTKTITLVK